MSQGCMTDAKIIPIRDYGSLETAKKAMSEWKTSSENKKDALRFLDDLSAGKVFDLGKISDARLIKFIVALKPSLESFSKPFEQLTLQDIERFEKSLSTGKIKSTKDQPYAPSTQVEVKRLLKVYLKWKLGDTNEVRKLYESLNTKDTDKKLEYLKESEIEQLYKNCKNATERFLVAVLFDSGAKAEEFHNIRYEDIKLPTAKDNSLCITFQDKYSSTKGRTICLYWKHSAEAVRDFIKERVADKIKAKDPIYNKSYDNTRKIIRRLGKNTLDKNLNYQLFRNSSTMYYSTRLTREQLCHRYGWKLSSTIPDMYASMHPENENKDKSEKFSSAPIEELRNKIETQEQEIRILKDAQKATAQALSELKRKLKK